MDNTNHKKLQMNLAQFSDKNPEQREKAKTKLQTWVAELSNHPKSPSHTNQTKIIYEEITTHLSSATSKQIEYDLNA
jgi:hypothetical protein